jgi:hypothetical protein
MEDGLKEEMLNFGPDFPVGEGEGRARREQQPIRPIIQAPKGELLRKQDQKRQGFDKRWQRKTEQIAREAARELAKLRRVIEYWERDLV